MIKYKCTKCGAILESPKSMAGQQDKCPLCGYVCTVPESKGRSADSRRVLPSPSQVAGLSLGLTVLPLVAPLVPLAVVLLLSGGSRSALDGFINGVFCMMPLVLIVSGLGAIASGIRAIRQMKRPDQTPKGKRIAIAGIVIGGLEFLGGLCFYFAYFAV